MSGEVIQDGTKIPPNNSQIQRQNENSDDGSLG